MARQSTVQETQEESQPRREELHVRTLLPMARWVSDRWGPVHLARICNAIDLAPDELHDRDHWVSHAEVEHFLADVRALAGTDEVFQTACVYRMAESHGPLRYLLWASTPTRMIRMMERSAPRQSRISTYDIEDHGEGLLTLTYASEAKESRLMCLARQSQLRMGPTLWSLPPALVEETSCIAHGDDSCTYELRLYETSRWSQSLLGLAFGAVVAFALSLVGIVGLPGWAILPLVGALAGYITEHRRRTHANLGIAHQVQQAIAEHASEAATGRNEMEALYRRQREWTRVVERRLLESPIEAKVELHPETVHLPSLARTLQERAQGLVFERDIRAIVISDRKLPPTFDTDRRVFDRVVDDLLVNAARHTARGTIAVHLRASPAFLTVRITDDSRGMTRERIERLFDPDAGLAMAVILLAQLGGKLEVASLPEAGATFWLRFPFELQQVPGDDVLDRSYGALVQHVVTIRHKELRAV